MLNRRQLRIKVMEVIYAYDKSIEKNIDFQLNYFLTANKNFYRLYISVLSVFKSKKTDDPPILRPITVIYVAK